MRSWWSAAAFALGALLVAACSDDDERGAAAGSSGDGAAVYERSCASCHGSDLRGTDQGPSHLSRVYEPGHHPDESFRAAITEGAVAHHWSFGDMPPVSGLDEDEIEAVIAFIREQQELHGLEPYPPR
jgi:mono/diheme cytochrome c family protein